MTAALRKSITNKNISIHLFYLFFIFTHLLDSNKKEETKKFNLGEKCIRLLEGAHWISGVHLGRFSLLFDAVCSFLNEYDCANDIFFFLSFI